MLNSTTEILNQIVNATDDEISALVKKIEESQLNPNELLEEIIEKSAKTKNQIKNELGISTYIYEITNGSKKPKRNMLLQILVCLGVDLKICNRILRLYNYSPLYPKSKFDSLVIYAIKNNYSVSQLEDLLFDYDLLFSDE